jgi:hypothetical protein
VAQRAGPEPGLRAFGRAAADAGFAHAGILAQSPRDVAGGAR